MAAAAMTLRLALPRDARPIASMSRDLIENGLGWSYPPRRVAALIADRDTTVVVACDDAGIAGFAAMSFGDERAHLILLAVRPPRRRRGIGSQLLQWLVASARVAGIAAIELELRVANDAARAFYRAHGFVECGRVDGYYSGLESALRMACPLRRAGDPG